MVKKAELSIILTTEHMRSIIKPQSTFDHKGMRGHALLIAGSYGKMGAAVLAARGALRTGVGLLTVHIPRIGYTILQTTTPEAMVSVDNSEFVFSSTLSLDAFSAVGVGPGLGQGEKTVHALTTLLKTTHKPMVIDADALNIIATHKNLLASVPHNSILTPHPKELERLTQPCNDRNEQIELQREFAVTNRVFVVLKGAHTTIATPNGMIYVNNTGNPGMATGGMGDVLTGVITSLLAQGYDPLSATQLGVWLHGLAGDIVTQKRGQYGMLASDLADHLPEAFVALLTHTPNK